MDLKGKLRVFQPISVFQLINVASGTGELTVETDENSAHVYFDRGDITYADMNRRPIKLGEQLVREGVLSREQLDGVLDKRPRGRKLGALLIDEGIVDEATLRRVLEDQVKEVIYEVVRWIDGSFWFVEGREPVDREIAIDIPLDRLMLEGLKRLDEEGEPGE